MKRRTRSVLQRRPSSLGRTPDINIPSVKIPPDVPSPWANVRPASSSACTTPACHATRIPPPASTSARCGSSGTGRYASVSRTAAISAGGGGIERGEREALLAESLRANAADRPRSRHRSWPPSPSAAPSARRPCDASSSRRAPSTSRPPDTAMNMPMIRNRNGAGSARPGAQDAQHRPGCRDQRQPRHGRRPTDRDRGLVQHIRLWCELRIRASRCDAVIARPRRALGRRHFSGTTSSGESPGRPRADRATPCCSGRPNTEPRSSPPQRSPGSTASGRRDEPRFEVIVEHTLRVRKAGGEQCLARHVERSQGIHPGMITDEQLGLCKWPDRDLGAVGEVDRRLHQHSAELAPVHGTDLAEWDLWPMRPVDGDPHAEFAVEVVLARHRVVVDAEVEICLMLRHAPDALAALHRDQ